MKSSNNQIRIGIIGYGNVGKGVELAVNQNPDLVLAGIFTRRSSTSSVRAPKTKLFHISELDEYCDSIDVAILCGGSATDLPEHGPKFSSMFNTVDSYDTHANMLDYFNKVDEAARSANKTSVIAIGWDPGLFSLMRFLFESTLPIGKSYTFWGPGVSQGHSNAVRGIKGVKNAVQYTIPIEISLKRVRNGENPTLTSREMHKRVCYVVPEDDADLVKIKREIVTMPNYFEPYDTDVYFIPETEFLKKYSEMPHGGFVLRSGTTGEKHKELMEFSVKLDSNPEFTGSIMAAYARAAYRLNREGNYGAKTVLDIAPAYLSIKPKNILLKGL